MYLRYETYNTAIISYLGGSIITQIRTTVNSLFGSQLLSHINEIMLCSVVFATHGKIVGFEKRFSNAGRFYENLD